MLNRVDVFRFLCLVLIGIMGLIGCADTSSYDVIIANGTIVDGTGKPGYIGDVGIRGETIAKIGNLSKAKSENRIDATGLIVAP